MTFHVSLLLMHAERFPLKEIAELLKTRHLHNATSLRELAISQPQMVSRFTKKWSLNQIQRSLNECM